MPETEKLKKAIQDIQSEISRKRIDGKKYYTPAEIDCYMTCIGFILRRMGGGE